MTSHRRQVIQVLLERYSELVDPLRSGSGVRGDGGSVALTPHERSCALVSSSSGLNRCTCAYRGVRELERLLRLMRDEGGQIVRLGAFVDGLPAAQQSIRVSVRGLWWHLNARYIAATERTVDVPVTRRSKNGKKLRVMERRAVATYDQRVSPIHVSAGVAWLAAGWALEVEPMVPVDLLVAA